jgi:sugar phosphate isomerase/epimerase
MKTRREFLKSLPFLATGYIVAQTSAKANIDKSKTTMKTAIQLWSLKDLVNSDLIATLKELSRIGFDGIEAYGFDGKFYGYSSKEFKNICDDLNLRIFSSHAGITPENAATFANSAAEAGLEYLVLPSLGGYPQTSIADFQLVAGHFNTIGEICRQHQIQFAYHNHDFEFKVTDGLIPYDILLKETVPALVDFQMDTYWIVKAGFDPVEYINQHPGRFSTLHIKDLARDGQSCIVGNGTIDFTSLMQHTENAGTRLLIYEQEHFAEGEPLYCTAQSLQYIKEQMLNFDF